MSLRFTQVMRTAAFVLLLAACDDSPSSPVSMGGDEAQLTILNALLTAGPFNRVQLDGQNVVIPETGDARGIAIEGGSHRLDAVDGSGKVLARADFTVGAGGRRTAILTGADQDVFLLVASDTTDLPAAGATKIRIVHMAEGTSLFDAYLYRANTEPTLTDLAVNEFGYGGATPTSFPVYLERPTSGYRVRLTQAGSINSIVDSPIFHALSRQVWSVVLTRSGSGALTLIPILER